MKLNAGGSDEVGAFNAALDDVLKGELVGVVEHGKGEWLKGLEDVKELGCGGLFDDFFEGGRFGGLCFCGWGGEGCDSICASLTVN